MAWGASFFLAKGAIKEVGVWPYLGWRFLLAPLVLGLMFPRKILSVNKDFLFYGFLSGGALFISIWSQTIGLQFTTAGRSGFITSLYVTFTPFMAWLILKQKILMRQVFVALIAIAGLYLLTQQGELMGISQWLILMNKGDMWTILTAVATAAQIVVIERFARTEADSIAVGLWQFMGCAVACIPLFSLYALTGGDLSGLWDPRGWSNFALGAMAFNVLVVTCFGFVMQIICQKTVGAFKAALIFGLEGPFAMIFGYLFLAEVMGPIEATGAALVFLTSIIPERWLKRT